MIYLSINVTEYTCREMIEVPCTFVAKTGLLDCVCTFSTVRCSLNKAYNTIQSSVAFIMVVHCSEIVFKQSKQTKKKKPEKRHNQQKKLQVTVRNKIVKRSS